MPGHSPDMGNTGGEVRGYRNEVPMSRVMEQMPTWDHAGRRSSPSSMCVFPNKKQKVWCIGIASLS